jgi:hypothetical protein
MLSLEHLLLGTGIIMFVSAALVLGYDICARVDSEKESRAFVRVASTGLHWRNSVALAMLAWAPLLISAAIVFVPLYGERASETDLHSRERTLSPIAFMLHRQKVDRES